MFENCGAADTSVESLRAIEVVLKCWSNRLRLGQLREDDSLMAEQLQRMMVIGTYSSLI